MSTLNLSNLLIFANSALDNELKPFIGQQQRAVLKGMLKGEERQHFAEMLLALRDRVESMPKTYEQDGKGVDAVVYLHYFRGSIDAWITEKDMGDGSDDKRQLQAFGAVNLMGTGLRIDTDPDGTRYVSGDAEVGYVCIQELIDNGVELDLYWTPKTLAECAK